MGYKQTYDCLILGWQFNIDNVYFGKKTEVVFNVNEGS